MIQVPFRYIKATTGYLLKMSSGEEDWEVNDDGYDDYRYFSTEDKFYLDDDEVDENTFEQPTNIVEVSAARMAMISSFVQQLNLNPTNINTATGQRYFRDAIAAKCMDIVHKFIEYQVDLNASDDNNWTPLHHAVSGNNIECVCLLLSYGVDVRIKSVRKVTPLTLAFKLKCKEIIKVLLNYYYEFSNVNVTNIKLDYKYRLDIYTEDTVLLTIAMDNGYVEPFKLIWQRIDLYSIIRLPNSRFIQKYLYNSIFAPANKADCLYLTLDMAAIGYLLRCFNFFLHKAFLSSNFDQTRRMDLLFTILSTGVQLNFEHITYIYQVSGFNKELEALIYAGNCDWSGMLGFGHYSKFLYDILSFNLNTNTYYDYCKQLKENMQIYYPRDFIPWLKHFSLPFDVKCNPGNTNLQENNVKLLNYLHEVSEFPSLLELGRLAVQNLIKQTHNITKEYHFHDAVKNLCLPQHLKDIVLFKKPIYK